MGLNTPAANKGLMRVFTITITAPQQGHGMGARGFRPANGFGTNFSSERELNVQGSPAALSAR